MRHSRNSSRGFTLVELMVSLAAGLVVTIAVVGLARAATTTFFEAARISSVEATVRNASERLRQDLARTAYMSTGNIRLARDGAPGVPLAHRIAVPNPSLVGASGSRITALDNLQGVSIIVGGSGLAPIANAGTPALSTPNGLNPDALILGGNYTTDDSYVGTLLPGPSLCGGQIVALNSVSDAAVRRLLGGAVPLAGLQAAFTPVPGRLYAARVVDPNGCQHFVQLCQVAMAGAIGQVHLALDTANNPSVMGTGVTTCGGDPTEDVVISPVHRVRWYIGPNTDPSLDPDPGVEPAASKFNLYREFLDAANPPAPIAATRQIVAEYAIDLKFGITIADAANALQVYEMDDAIAAPQITLWTQPAGGTAAGGPAPHRVRSVRFRIATRATVPDRRFPLTSSPGAPYLTRYCVDPPGCTKYSRVRTVVSEVALINQLGMSY